MRITTNEALFILETALPNITYKDMMKALDYLSLEGIIDDSKPEKKCDYKCGYYEAKRKQPEPQRLNQPTPTEVAEWEKYNGKGSYSSKTSPKGNSKPIQVSDENTFKSIFEKPKTGFTVKKDEEFPF